MMNKRIRGMKKATVALAIAASMMGSVAPVVAHAEHTPDVAVTNSIEDETRDAFLELLDFEIPDYDDGMFDGVDVNKLHEGEHFKVFESTDEVIYVCEKDINTASEADFAVPLKVEDSVWCY